MGAQRTFKLNSPGELQPLIDHPPEGFVVEKYVDAPMVTFDGLADREGGLLFSSSLNYGQSIMDSVAHGGEMHFHLVRRIPPALERIGRRVVEAFHVRERFFHIELFNLSEDDYVALEVNLRPPGGYIIDMMNYSADIDLYRLWAEVTVNGLSEFSFERKYCCGFVSRRYHLDYKIRHQDLLAELGPLLAFHGEIPPIFSQAMGNYAYLLRHPDEQRVLAGIALTEKTN